MNTYNSIHESLPETMTEWNAREHFSTSNSRSPLFHSSATSTLPTPRRAYRTPSWRRKQLGWDTIPIPTNINITTPDPYHSPPTLSMPATVTVPFPSPDSDSEPSPKSTSASSGAYEFIAIFTLYITVSVFGPCCFLYAGIHIACRSICGRSR